MAANNGNFKVKHIFLNILLYSSWIIPLLLLQASWIKNMVYFHCPTCIVMFLFHPYCGKTRVSKTNAPFVFLCSLCTHCRPIDFYKWYIASPTPTFLFYFEYMLIWNMQEYKYLVAMLLKFTTVVFIHRINSPHRWVEKRIIHFTG